MEDERKKCIELEKNLSVTRDGVNAMLQNAVRTGEQLNRLSDTLDELYEIAKQAFPEAYERYTKEKEAKGEEECVIRNLRIDEADLLKDFLYLAIFVPEGVEPPSRDIVEKPELRVYTDGFGTRRGDNCLVADVGGKVVGAVWTRIMDDYGHMDDGTPSFAISLHEEYRGRGIGSRLMSKMLELLRGQGYARASLAVQKANGHAVKMYEKVGFRIINENSEEYVMACEL